MIFFDIIFKYRSFRSFPKKTLGFFWTKTFVFLSKKTLGFFGPKAMLFFDKLRLFKKAEFVQNALHFGTEPEPKLLFDLTKEK